MVETQITMNGDTVSHLDTVEEIVRECLSEDERCRNDDKWLILRVWQRKQQIRIFIPYDKLHEMISPESIRRVRQKIQNTAGEFPPTDPAVIRRRAQREQEIHDWAVRNKAEVGNALESDSIKEDSGR